MFVALLGVVVTASIALGVLLGWWAAGVASQLRAHRERWQLAEQTVDACRVIDQITRQARDDLRRATAEDATWPR